jgi:hypothetical protein
LANSRVATVVTRADRSPVARWWYVDADTPRVGQIGSTPKPGTAHFSARVLRRWMLCVHPLGCVGLE